MTTHITYAPTERAFVAVSTICWNLDTSPLRLSVSLPEDVRFHLVLKRPFIVVSSLSSSSSMRPVCEGKRLPVTGMLVPPTHSADLTDNLTITVQQLWQLVDFLLNGCQSTLSMDLFTFLLDGIRDLVPTDIFNGSRQVLVGEQPE